MVRCNNVGAYIIWNELFEQIKYVGNMKQAGSLLLIDVEKSDADRLICRQKESKFGKIDEFSNQLQLLIYGLNFFYRPLLYE